MDERNFDEEFCEITGANPNRLGNHEGGYLADICIETENYCLNLDNPEYINAFSNRIKSGLMISIGCLTTLSMATVIYLQVKGR